MRSVQRVSDDQPLQDNDANSLHAITTEINLPVLICLLGNFHLRKMGQIVKIRSGGKVESLLCALALASDHRIPRDTLLYFLWPKTEPILASQSLNSLVYSLHKVLGDAIGGAAPVLYAGGCYQINLEAGIGVDVAAFDALADAGDRQARVGSKSEAAATYDRAIQLYWGDLGVGEDIHALLERERLRTRYLTLLMHVADYYYSEGDHTACIDYARRLLDKDPCCEDAHRMIMRCLVRRGERAQALRQYRLCQDILRAEFDAVPEPATTVLYNQVRLDPSSV